MSQPTGKAGVVLRGNAHLGNTGSIPPITRATVMGPGCLLANNGPYAPLSKPPDRARGPGRRCAWLTRLGTGSVGRRLLGPSNRVFRGARGRPSLIYRRPSQIVFISLIKE